MRSLQFPEGAKDARCDPVLELYRKSLPERELAALEAWLGVFYPFQQGWLLEPAAYAICNKARQIGLSHTGSAIGVLWGAFHGELTTIISVGDRESAEVLDKARKHASILTRLGSRMAQTGKRDNATELSFASGGRIIALPSTGGRSFTGNVFLDEYAYQQHAAKVWDAAGAVTMLGDFRLRVISTPNGVGNEFHELWGKAAAPSFGWKRHEIPIEDATAQRYPVDLKKCWTLAKGDPRIFDQLFHCKFLDNELQYIPGEFISRATVDRIDQDGDVFAGLDIGETRDRTVLVLLRKNGARKSIFHVESHKRTDDALLDALVGKAFGFHRAKRLCADATGLGSMPATRFSQRYGSKFEPVDFTLTTKEEMATGLYSALAEEELKIPRQLPVSGEDEAALLREDMAAIRRVVSEAGNVKYTAPRTDAGHADRAWSAMLALRAAQNSFSYGRLQ